MDNEQYDVQVRVTGRQLTRPERIMAAGAALLAFAAWAAMAGVGVLFVVFLIAEAL